MNFINGEDGGGSAGERSGWVLVMFGLWIQVFTSEYCPYWFLDEAEEHGGEGKGPQLSYR